MKTLQTQASQQIHKKAIYINNLGVFSLHTGRKKTAKIFNIIKSLASKTQIFSFFTPNELMKFSKTHAISFSHLNIGSIKFAAGSQLKDFVPKIENLRDRIK